MKTKRIGNLEIRVGDNTDMIATKRLYLLMTVTVASTVQVSMDDFETIYTSKTFEETATIKEINDWIKSVEKGSDIFHSRISKSV